MEITIRHTDPEDFEALYTIFRDPKAVSGTLQLPFPSKESWRKLLAEPAEGLFSLVACEGNSEGEVVGNIVLKTQPTSWRAKHVGSIGMAVRDDRRGRGVGSELMRAVLELADDWLDLTRVELTVYTDNEAGIALYKKFGFEVEGTHRRYAFRSGEYVDAHTMARIKE